MRGLSGAVTALILVVASVVIALIVVGFAFNLFGNFASQGANTVTQVGSAYLYTTPPPYTGITAPTSGNYVYLVATFNNKGPNVNITSIAFNSTVYTPYSQMYIIKNNQATSVNGVYIPTGQNTLVILLPVTSGQVTQLSSISGGTVNMELRLGSGNQVIELTAIVVNS
jgi:hypothetical protein